MALCNILKQKERDLIAQWEPSQSKCVNTGRFTMKSDISTLLLIHAVLIKNLLIPV